MATTKVSKRVHSDGWTRETVMMLIPVHIMYEKPKGRAVAIRTAKSLHLGTAITGCGSNGAGAYNVRLGRLQQVVEEVNQKEAHECK